MLGFKLMDWKRGLRGWLMQTLARRAAVLPGDRLPRWLYGIRCGLYPWVHWKCRIYRGLYDVETDTFTINGDQFSSDFFQCIGEAADRPMVVFRDRGRLTVRYLADDPEATE